MRNVKLAMRLAFIKEHETRRSPTDRRKNLWKSAGSVGVKTKRSMRLKRQVGESVHGSQMPCGVFLSKEHESPMKGSTVGG